MKIPKFQQCATIIEDSYSFFSYFGVTLSNALKATDWPSPRENDMAE